MQSINWSYSCSGCSINSAFAGHEETAALKLTQYKYSYQQNFSMLEFECHLLLP